MARRSTNKEKSKQQAYNKAPTDIQESSQFSRYPRRYSSRQRKICEMIISKDKINLKDTSST